MESSKRLPALLFAHLENELIKLVKELRGKFSLCNINLSCAAFADNICLVSVSKNSMEMMFDVAYHYRCNWRFLFSPQKCKLVIVGKYDSKDIRIKFGNCKSVESYFETHLCLGLVTTKRLKSNILVTKLAIVNHYYTP